MENYSGLVSFLPVEQCSLEIKFSVDLVFSSVRLCFLFSNFQPYILVAACVPSFYPDFDNHARINFIWFSSSLRYIYFISTAFRPSSLWIQATCGVSSHLDLTRQPSWFNQAFVYSNLKSPFFLSPDSWWGQQWYRPSSYLQIVGEFI